MRSSCSRKCMVLYYRHHFSMNSPCMGWKSESGVKRVMHLPISSIKHWVWFCKNISFNVELQCFFFFFYMKWCFHLLLIGVTGKLLVLSVCTLSLKPVCGHFLFQQQCPPTDLSFNFDANKQQRQLIAELENKNRYSFVTATSLETGHELNGWPAG